MNSSRGIILMVSAISCFSIMAALVKAADRVPAGEIVFFRAFCALPVILVWLAWRGELRSGLRVRDWRQHAIRAVAGSTAMGLGFVGLKLLPLPEVTAIRFVTPIFIVALAAIMLGERIRLIRISAVLLGLVGVLVIIWPRLSFDLADLALVGVLVTLGSAVLAALAHVLVKSMAGTESTTAIVFYFLATATALSLLTAPFGWVWPRGLDWVWVIGAGLVGGLGQILSTSSYKYADASSLAPFSYVSMLWALGIGFFIFAEVPTVPMLIGSALVILAGVIIVVRERRLGSEKTAERKVKALMKNG